MLFNKPISAYLVAFTLFLGAFIAPQALNGATAAPQLEDSSDVGFSVSIGSGRGYYRGGPRYYRRGHYHRGYNRYYRHHPGYYRYYYYNDPYYYYYPGDGVRFYWR